MDCKLSSVHILTRDEMKYYTFALAVLAVIGGTDLFVLPENEIRDYIDSFTRTLTEEKGMSGNIDKVIELLLSEAKEWAGKKDDV